MPCNQGAHCLMRTKNTGRAQHGGKKHRPLILDVSENSSSEPINKSKVKGWGRRGGACLRIAMGQIWQALKNLQPSKGLPVEPAGWGPKPMNCI